MLQVAPNIFNASTESIELNFHLKWQTPKYGNIQNAGSETLTSTSLGEYMWAYIFFFQFPILCRSLIIHPGLTLIALGKHKNNQQHIELVLQMKGNLQYWKGR